MLMPAQQLPISLIGSMWNLSPCWFSPEERWEWGGGWGEGCMEEEESAEVYCVISVTLALQSGV